MELKKNRITKKLCYGVNEDTDERLLYVKRITISNYKEPVYVKTFMELLDNFKIFQYNYNKAYDCDYFFWQYVNDNGEKNWQSADLSVYYDDMSGIFKMGKLVEILENTYSNLDVIIMYDDINNLVNKINKDIEFERGVK